MGDSKRDNNQGSHQSRSSHQQRRARGLDPHRSAIREQLDKLPSLDRRCPLTMPGRWTRGDLGKNSCSLVGLDASGRVIKRRRIRPENISAFTELMPAKAQKNDDRDAEAIAEAASRPTMRFVELKSEAQLDMQTLHRARDRLVGERTALVNQLRAILLERGVTVAQGRHKLEGHLAAMLDTGADSAIIPRMRRLIEDVRAEWLELDQRIAAFDYEFAACARSDADARRLATRPSGEMDTSISPITRVMAWADIHGSQRRILAIRPFRRRTGDRVRGRITMSAHRRRS
jgi:transposase